MKQGWCSVTGHISSQNRFYPGAPPIFWMASDGPLENICDEKRWENSEGVNNLYSDNFHLILHILQLVKCLSFFIHLVPSFSSEKNKAECKLSYVQLQLHFIVYQLKSIWNVNHGPVTAVFSVLQTMTFSSCLPVSFCGKHKHAKKKFIFSCNTYFVLLKK